MGCSYDASLCQMKNMMKNYANSSSPLRVGNQVPRGESPKVTDLGESIKVTEMNHKTIPRYYKI